MPAPGWKSISLKDDLIKKVDEFVRSNDEGFSNRADVVAAAIRQFVQDYYARKAVERAVRSLPARPRAGAAPARRRRR